MHADLSTQEIISCTGNVRLSKMRSPQEEFEESVNRRRTDNSMAKRKKGQRDKQRSTKHTHKT